jgi:hypothetical protein
MSTLPRISLRGAPRPAAYAAAVVALAAGGWFAWTGWQQWQAYVPLGVRVIESRVDTLSIAGLPKYGAAVMYEFVYDGITMTSSTVVKGNPEMSAREAAKWVRKYPVGTETAGYLNSDNPNDVVLERENHFDLPLLVAVLGLGALLFLLWEDRERWLPMVQRSGGGSSGSAKWVDPRGRPPELNMKPPAGMEGAIWDPSPGDDGLPRGWVRPEDQ